MERRNSAAIVQEVFHRKETSTQTPAIALLQVASGEVWGREARWSSLLAVRVYRALYQMGEEALSSLRRSRRRLAAAVHLRRIGILAIRLGLFYGHLPAWIMRRFLPMLRICSLR